jgi:microcystin-dependent protein
MSGTIALSMSQRFDNATFKPLSGGKLYFYQAGTLTPQSAFQDSALAIPYPNPITLDHGGNVPQFFLADGLIRIRLTNAAGVQQLSADNLLVVGPSSGGGGGGSVDPTTVFSTGDLKPRYGTGALGSWVRCNGRTIGRSTSGATERANADTQALYELLWNVDPNLVVSGGRGASAAADWSADKTIALPDFRGRALAGLDGMGNLVAGRITSSFLGTDPDVLGAAGGLEKHVLTQAQIPKYNIAGFTSSESALHSHSYSRPQYTNLDTNTGPAPFGWGGAFDTASTSDQSQYHTHSINLDSGGGDAPHNNIPPTMLVTIYIRL